MPKKTSRAARTQQNQLNTGKKRQEAARPLVSSSSALVDNDSSTEVAPAPQRTGIYDAPAIAATTPQSQETTRTVPAARPRGPLPTRRFVGTRQPAISREDEYNFVRSDLRTVLILTVLMIIALVVLTIILGR